MATAVQPFLGTYSGEWRLDPARSSDEFEIEAKAVVDQRELGMTWSPLGMVRAPAKLLVRGRLVRSGPA
jgi:hypothetical protein